VVGRAGGDLEYAMRCESAERRFEVDAQAQAQAGEWERDPSEECPLSRETCN
jgi:hypothetical protein